jgi:zinc-ribbon domain
MKRLLPRPPRRRAKSTEEPTAAQTAVVEPTEAQAGLPAGAEPEDPTAPPRPSFRNRGRLRRRLRYLRRARELGFRDLGGLVFDQHKFNRPNQELVRGKVTALAAVDTELRALAQALADRRDVTELREPGISACPRCGTLHGSDARFCPNCGLSISGARAIAPNIAEGAQAEPEPQPAVTHTAEREASKLPADAANGRDAGDQPTTTLRPTSERRDA